MKKKSSLQWEGNVKISFEKNFLFSDLTIIKKNRMLADLPVDIQIGKMLIMASMYHVSSFRFILR
jgi:hypothetical protein